MLPTKDSRVQISNNGTVRFCSGDGQYKSLTLSQLTDGSYGHLVITGGMLTGGMTYIGDTTGSLSSFEMSAGTLANGSGPSFIFNSANGDCNNAFGTAGISAQLGNHFGGYCYYTPQFGGRQITSHGVIAGVTYNF